MNIRVKLPAIAALPNYLYQPIPVLILLDPLHSLYITRQKYIHSSLPPLWRRQNRRHGIAPRKHRRQTHKARLPTAKIRLVHWEPHLACRHKRGCCARRCERQRSHMARGIRLNQVMVRGHQTRLHAFDRLPDIQCRRRKSL